MRPRPGVVVGSAVRFAECLAVLLVFPTVGASQPVPVDLGTLGGTSSTPVAVSANGQVVGSSSLPGDAVSHAFSWTETGGMVDLGTLRGSFSDAYAVNSDGQVVGISWVGPDYHAFSGE